MPQRIQFRRRTLKYSAGRNSLLRRQQNDEETPGRTRSIIPLIPVTESTTLERPTATEVVTLTEATSTLTRATSTLDTLLPSTTSRRSSVSATARGSSPPTTTINPVPSTSVSSDSSFSSTSDPVDQDGNTIIGSDSTPPIAPPPLASNDVSGALDGASSTDVAPSSSNVKSKGLSTGAIAGIAVVGTVVLVVVIAFLIRRTIAAKRAKRRDDWFEKSLFSSPQAPPSIVSSDASSISASVFPPPPTTFGTASRPPPSYAYAMPPPPSRQPSIASLARPGTPPSLIPGRRGGDLAEPPAPFQAQASAVPIGVPTAPPTMAAFYPPPIAPAPQPPQTALNPPRSTTVRSSFVPTREDELLISGGEVVYVLQEYDDGWGLCLNQAGKQGAVPLECLNDGTREDKPALTRGSSLSRK
ncbi:hypothetical protein PM082_006921 [Marasmius tenuissimus]|nr:hypothetical protein PM082_006921 [Marasmius tenuissimus]